VNNSTETARTIATLLDAGRLDPDEDAATIQQARSLAAAVDADPGNAALWREFRQALDTLREVSADDGGTGDEVALIIAALRGSTEVVNTKDAKSPNTRTRGGTARRTARQAADAVAERSS
jgi:hypothetical protein